MKKILLPALVALAASPLARADGVAVESGLWEMSMDASFNGRRVGDCPAK